jgi:5-methylcytosine-specific restriction endonuclease McrA
MRRKIKVTDEEIIITSKQSNSATHAASILGIKYETYKVHAKRLNCFITNQSGKGTTKKKIDGQGKIPLREILDGKHPQYQANKLRKRLFEENLKDEKCEVCGIEEWLGKRIALELDHIDGNRYNHSLTNLRIICPNCHSQTHTYRGKNKSGHGGIGRPSGLKTRR